MTQIKWLYQLQQVDLEIDAATEALQRVDSQLGDRTVIEELLISVEQKRQALEKLTTEQRHAEWEAQDRAKKLADVENKLYGGSVRIPKELSSLQQEGELLKQKHREIEDRLLATMVENDARHQEIANDMQEFTRMEREWQGRQAELSKEQASIKATVDTLNQKLQELLPHIERADLEIYQDLRISKQGKAVARVEQGMCQGCRISLPSNQLQLVRAGNRLVQCGSCQRILYME